MIDISNVVAFLVILEQRKPSALVGGCVDRNQKQVYVGYWRKLQDKGLADMVLTRVHPPKKPDE